MGYAFTEDQEFFRTSVERCLAREMDFAARQKLLAAGAPHSKAVWSAFAEMGLLGLPFPEARGGMDGSAADLAAVCEVMGRRMAVEPYVSTVVLGGLALAGAPSTPARDALLEEVAAGTEHLALAHEEGHGTPDPARVALAATRSGAGWRLAGEKRLALGADIAGWLVVSARVSGAPGDEDGLALFLVPADAPGLSSRAYRTIDGRTGAHLALADVELGPEALLAEGEAGFALLRHALDRGMLALCAEAVGAMAALLAATADYANGRKQFGVAIGSFQALRHRIADMYMAHQRCRASLLVTAAMLDAGEARPRHLSILKAQVGRLGRELGASAVQVHGGMGTTDELEVGHHVKRILAAGTLFGTDQQHRRLVGQAMGRSRNAVEAL
ncbi:acyl-CoA dehydrogenase family protein [Albimonas sp. CAU 1670]|uniref:acyl-CoA dehydrogenase family protein n=1 Tax=Albimonas sp. CAU 1670 TaxID=3032599 RepID=UPI0023DC9061|nr:acyl-CoA dehydrogenase family protein [Albimonas sp. CAU 1670]MDF2233758.1 acyl-CoA dehydrogenase family protein [Albimonas sp. CAU 1670]